MNPALPSISKIWVPVGIGWGKVLKFSPTTTLLSVFRLFRKVVFLCMFAWRLWIMVVGSSFPATFLWKTDTARNRELRNIFFLQIAVVALCPGSPILLQKVLLSCPLETPIMYVFVGQAFKTAGELRFILYCKWSPDLDFKAGSHSSRGEWQRPIFLLLSWQI